jgi:hypothetical protein
MDLGGTNGALWRFEFEDQVLVALRTSSGTAAKTAPQSGVADPLGSPIDLSTFCFRSDVVCPQQVLPSPVALLQPSITAGTFLIDFNRRGPLATLRNATGLAGQLSGAGISVPLGTGEVATDLCSLGASSMLLGTAAATGGDGTRADFIQGRLTVSYDGTCMNLGGAAGMEAGARVDLSMGFRASRQ